MKTELPRSMHLAQDSITATDLHVLVDASTAVNCAAVYAVVHQPSKSQISKHNITISRFELISTHSGANLVQNVKSALESQNVRSVTGWTDSTVVLPWLKERGYYKQFVGNRVNKVREKELVNWYYVPTKENPADIVSRGSLIANISQVWGEDPS